MRLFDHNCRAWLPADTLDRGDFDRALGEAIGRWSAKWFAAAPWRLSREGPADAGRCWRGLSDGLAIGLASDSSLAIAAAMLGGVPGQGFKEPNDRRLAGILADACLDDLQDRLLQLFRLPAECQWREDAYADLIHCGAPYRATLGVSPDRPHVHLAVAQDLLIAWIKAGVAAFGQPIELGSLEQSLARQVIEVGARIGGCELSLADLDSLGIGDVLVLDQSLDHPLELALDGRSVGRRCVIDSTETRLALELVEPFVE